MWSSGKPFEGKEEGDAHFQSLIKVGTLESGARMIWNLVASAAMWGEKSQKEQFSRKFFTWFCSTWQRKGDIRWGNDWGGAEVLLSGGAGKDRELTRRSFLGKSLSRKKRKDNKKTKNGKRKKRSDRGKRITCSQKTSKGMKEKSRPEQESKNGENKKRHHHDPKAQ